MTTETNNNYNKNRQKRKKKSGRFLRNAKGFAKQGIYGRGAHIEDDHFKYFINILDSMKTGFEDVEDKVNMANNVFEQIKDKEVHFASNQIVSKALESLAGFVDAENLEQYFKAFADNFRPVCSDRYASHVLQKVVEIAFLRYVSKDNEITETDSVPAKRPKVDMLSEENYNLETDFTAEHKQNCGQFVERVSKFLLNNLEDFVWDSCANHIMRTCVLSLAGIHVPKVAFQKCLSDMQQNRKLYKVPEEWFEVMKEFPQRLEMWPQFAELPYEEHSSALLGAVCTSLKVVDKKMIKHFGKKIVMEAFLKVDADDSEKNKKIEILDDDEAAMEEDKNPTDSVKDEKEIAIKLPKVFEHSSALFLLETILTVAGPKLITQCYAMLFAGRIALLAQGQSTNFSVQKLLQNIKEKDDFENIFDELGKDTEDLLKIGHTGVVAALSAACLRLAVKQSQMIQALQSALHIAGDKEKSKSFFQCLIKLKPYEVMLEDKSTFVHLHGSLIVQNILNFNKPIFLVTCILETPPDQLLAVFNTPNGSHIVDAFVQSKFIGEKSREKLIRHMEGFYVDLATTKFGSRVVENLYSVANEAQKARIIKDLSDKSNMLKGTPFGQLLYKKFRIETYQKSPAQWKAGLQQKENKAAELFKDIIS